MDFDDFEGYADADDNFGEQSNAIRATDLLQGGGASQPGAPSNGGGGKGFTRTTGTGAAGEEDTKTKRPPREKLDFERLKSEAGVPDVYKTFRTAFKKQAKGKGHEVGDLGRLLAMYERWHKRFFPYCEFDAFLQKVERVNGKPTGRDVRGSNMKGDMRELRAGVVQLACDLVQMQQPNEDAAADDARAASPGSQCGAGAAATAWDDAELNNLLAVAPPGPHSADEWDDDELDALMDAPALAASARSQQSAPSNSARAAEEFQACSGAAAPTRGAPAPWSDDDDDLDDMMADAGGPPVALPADSGGLSLNLETEPEPDLSYAV